MTAGMTSGALGLLLGAAALDVAANVLLKHSNGFQRPVPGVLALILIVVAFALLGQSLHTVALATAYATWGAAGVILTALLSRVLDGTALRPSAWAGLMLIGASMAALHSAG
ncbi:SMR family transporter [Deinococcus sp.]|uniref:SMR family transporter n=1 Tax=Deinococcus sp. TaxID=47478 RepID=UPI002869D85B|nr:SMR family transporter [Deinococcus sp.]